MERPLLLILVGITISSAAAADSLQNPDLEIPPANVTANGSASNIPGWSVNGTVWYVAWGGGGGHAVQLGPNGKINQTVAIAATRDDVLHYVLGFTVAAQNQDCYNNRTALNVTLSKWNGNVSRVIYLQKNSSRNLWERHALFLGQLGGGDNVDIELQSVSTTDTCWPLVDAFTVNVNHLPRWYDGNMLANAGFEVGPAFVKNSPDGVILTEELQVFESPLQEWEILGTVRYIDSNHYKVPRGRAAVELLSVSDVPSGVQKELMYLMTASTYTLNFTVGDANDSCVGDLTLYVEVGSSVRNFTVQSSGRGSAFKHSFTFKVEPSTQSKMLISFYSLNETRSTDGLLCGPVLDSIFLDSAGSYGQACNGVLVFTLFIAFLMFVVF